MKIHVNSKEQVFDGIASITISDLKKRMNFTFPMIVFKLNGKVVKKENWDSTLVREGDHIQAIHLIGGG
jgi:sulfur carrier protein